MKLFPNKLKGVLIVILLFLLLGTGGCDDGAEEEENAIPAWLQEKIDALESVERFEKIRIHKCNWDGQILYYIEAPFLYCQWCQVFDTKGQNLNLPPAGAERQDSFLETRTDDKIVWESPWGVDIRNQYRIEDVVYPKNALPKRAYYETDYLKLTVKVEYAYEFDDFNRVKKISYPTGLDRYDLYEYGTDNKIAKISYYQKDTNILLKNIFYFYDENGNKIKEHNEYIDRGTFDSTVYHYNNQKLIKSDHYSEFGDWSYSYEYKQNNSDESVFVKFVEGGNTTTELTNRDGLNIRSQNYDIRPGVSKIHNINNETFSYYDKNDNLIYYLENHPEYNSAGSNIPSFSPVIKYEY
jgi:hypothetical protein